ncbi:glycosyltransferase family 4 protein [Aerococcus urinaeequi]|uniref:glycosyltransferase family 4 protein n=1 Tax=Aerococcus urinaeequi TaxID=51665 RepID=UPI003D6C6E4C
MRIILIASYSGTSGANHSLVNLAYYLKENHQVNLKVVIPRHGPVEEMLKEKNIDYLIIKYYSWVRRNEKQTLFEKVKWKVQELVNKISESRLKQKSWMRNADLVHINASTTNFGYKLAKDLQIPLIWHIREFLEEDLNKTFWNNDKAYTQLSQAESVICISNSVKSKYEKILDSKKLVKIYNGIDTTIYQDNFNNPFTSQKTKLIFAGRIVREKGVHEAVKAMKLVAEYNNNVELNIYGDIANQDYYDNIENYINKHRLNNIVHLIGYTNSIEIEWKKSDIGLVCSSAEAFGRVTIEGMLSKTLVIGANTAGTSELISDKYGLLYHQGNVSDLSKKILWAIDNQSKSKKIIENAYDYATKKFTAENNAKNIFELYQTITCDSKTK